MSLLGFYVAIMGEEIDVREHPKQADLDNRRKHLGRELGRLQEQHQASEGNRVVTEVNAFGNS